MSLKGNKGEWSEIYALFKLLGDKELYLGNKELQKLKGAFYPIIKILRQESQGDFEYSIHDEVVIITGPNTKTKITIDAFKRKAKFLLEFLKKQKGSSFSIPEIENFMTEINCFQLKADSSKKTDISIIIHDYRTNQMPRLGFSLKSQLGNPSTLLNAGKTTNFIFEVNGNFSEDDITNINSLTKLNGSKESIDVKGRLYLIKELGGRLKYLTLEKKIFKNNLVLIDSYLPQILSHLVLAFYSDTCSDLSGLIELVSKSNPIGYDDEFNHKFYTYKINKFLSDVALGMMPSKVWNGQYDATGGYLVVKDDGEIVCYHIHNKNNFEDYLLNNTKLETASTTRHDFGKLYKEDGKLLFKLNLQIRFKK